MTELKSGDILIAARLSMFERHRILLIDADGRWTFYRPDGTVGCCEKDFLLWLLKRGFYHKANFTLADVFKGQKWAP